MLWRYVSSAVTAAVFMVRHQIEGKPPDKNLPDPPEVDCPLHGKTTLERARQTACCGSLNWVPSGDVTSRSCMKRKGTRRRKKNTIVAELSAAESIAIDHYAHFENSHLK
jgi:hypothetical protein